MLVQDFDFAMERLANATWVREPFDGEIAVDPFDSVPE